MLKVLSYCFVFAVVACLLLAQPLMAEEGVKGNLVSVNWLEKNLKNADVLILDASPTQIYTAKHIPGAVSVNINDLLSHAGRVKTLAFRRRLQQVFPSVW